MLFIDKYTDDVIVKHTLLMPMSHSTVNGVTSPKAIVPINDDVRKQPLEKIQ